MIALLAAGLLGFGLALGLILWLASRAPQPLDPEEAFAAAVELHQIRRQLDTDLTKADLRTQARDLERRALRELNDEP